MPDHTAEDLQEARAPIASLLSKSEKAQLKCAPGTWQRTMLQDNIAALRIATELMDGAASPAGAPAPEALERALVALGSMVGRTEKAQAKFAPGTSQHSLARNRLKALRIAESLVRAALPSGVSIRPYAETDLPLLRELLGDAEMMRFLGGPESEDALRARHERYLASDPRTNGLFTVLADGEAVGWVGFWESERDGDVQWECGWHVLAAHQGRGVATAAMRLALADASARGLHRYVDAFPAVDNAASNALCAQLGFSELGEVEVEYPEGRPMLARHWRLDLGAPRS